MRSPRTEEGYFLQVPMGSEASHHADVTDNHGATGGWV